MNNMNCQVKNCLNRALVLYGSTWVCGDCLEKLLEKEKQQKNKMIEELGNGN
jgi:hypothetical protein